MIKKILEEHNQICVQINSFNKYWRKYLSIIFFIYILSICFLSYLIFFAKIIWYLRLEFLIVLSAHILLVLVLTYFASSVSDFNHVLYRDLNSVYLKFNFPLRIKLEVSLSVKNTLKYQNFYFLFS